MLRLWPFSRKRSGGHPDRPLPFLDKDASQEYLLRVQKASAAEEVRHRQEEGRITQDFTSRGLLNSTAYTSAVMRERMEHFRNRIAIAREQIFAVIEARGIRLRQKKIKAIVDYLRSCFMEQGQQLLAEYGALHTQHGLPLDNLKSADMQIDNIVAAETVNAVVLKVADIENRRKASWRALRLRWAEKLIWMVVGTVVGALGAILLRWLVSSGD